MSSQNTEAIKRIFGGAIERPPEQHAAYLDRTCRGSGELRARVEKLLAAHAAAGDFL